MSAAIVCQALFFDKTPIAGLYITLDELQNSQVSYVGFTDKEGKISEWYEKTRDSMVSVCGNVNSAWRIGFYIGLVNGGPFNHVYTDFFVKACHHPITLCLAPEEYSVKFGPETQLAPLSWDHLQHPQPLPPRHLFLKPEATSSQTPQLTPSIGHPETPWQDLDAAPRDDRLTSPDFIALLENRLDELDSQNPPSPAPKPSRKRKRDAMEEDVEPPKPRRSERLLAKSKLH
ncbi:hypothetical protein N656DRAFT_426547 [Canariomyces notabilis]|uniref:Uncharacterized protein n=1 Tax=Canariomyces notabilis TaxID=2074819 RepID=A0AAN6T928_9PEZI|nr:hypothetical protein N656DRAFT_426547 [Canariomyces arenarius]